MAIDDDAAGAVVVVKLHVAVVGAELLVDHGFVAGDGLGHQQFPDLPVMRPPETMSWQVLETLTVV